MPTFDAAMHALTTVATGGFSTHDASFGAFGAGAEYVAVVFMILAALPFVRYVQLLNGSARPILVDSQIRGMLMALAVIAMVLTLWLWLRSEAMTELAFRKALFNGTSILTGTGFASANYMEWGSFAVVLMFFVGLIGGCAGSTSCSIKVFRYQLLFASISTQLRQIYSPSGLFTPRYEGRPVSEDVINSVMSFFVIFMVSLGLFSVLLGMTGLDVITSVSGAAAALANIGPGLGVEIGPAGNFGGLNDTAKWLLAAAMVLGRLELMAVFVIFSRTFWRG